MPDVPARARALAGQLAEAFASDQQLAQDQNDASHRLQAANDRLWWGLAPDGLAGVYDEHPAAVDQAFANNRSEVLGASDPLAAIQRVHWQLHRAFHDYQQASEQRRQLAADVGELTHQLIEVLTVAGWTEDQARNADVHQLAAGTPVR